MVVIGLFSNKPDINEEHLKSYISEDSGPTVTEDRIATIIEMLKEDDKVMHILRIPTLSHGNSNSDNNKSHSTVGKSGTAAFTQERVVIKIPHIMANDQFTVRYTNILSVAYNLEGILGHRQFTITTAQEKYRMGVHFGIDDDEVREIVDWVDMMAAKGNEDTSKAQGSATERLEELTRLKEQGLVTDDEFEKKRAEIVESL